MPLSLSQKPRTKAVTGPSERESGNLMCTPRSPECWAVPKGTVKGSDGAHTASKHRAGIGRRSFCAWAEVLPSAYRPFPCGIVLVAAGPRSARPWLPSLLPGTGPLPALRPFDVPPPPELCEFLACLLKLEVWGIWEKHTGTVSAKLMDRKGDTGSVWSEGTLPAGREKHEFAGESPPGAEPRSLKFTAGAVPQGCARRALDATSLLQVEVETLSPAGRRRPGPWEQTHTQRGQPCVPTAHGCLRREDSGSRPAGHRAPEPQDLLSDETPGAGNPGPSPRLPGGCRQSTAPATEKWTEHASCDALSSDLSPA